MAFDPKKFKQSKFIHRTKLVPVPDLADWFDEDETPAWEVRGLTGKELGVTKQAAAKNKSLAGIMEMLNSSKVVEKTKALQAVFDMDLKGTTENIAERLEQLVMGSVNPTCDLDLALKICERRPVDFYNLTNEILKLTGGGMELGKPKGSGKKRTSGPR